MCCTVSPLLPPPHYICGMMACWLQWYGDIGGGGGDDAFFMLVCYSLLVVPCLSFANVKLCIPSTIFVSYFAVIFLSFSEDFNESLQKSCQKLI